MRRGQIVDLDGRFGLISATGIWDIVLSRGLDGLFLDARYAGYGEIAYIRSRGLTPGLLVSPSWPEVPDDGPGTAHWMNNRLNQLGFTGAHAADVCDVMFDNEHHDNADVLAMLHAWRVDCGRYKRQTYWTPEPLQAGWFTDALVTAINGDVNLGVVGQAYRGNMAPVDPAAVRADLTRRGIDDVRAKVYYGTYYKTYSGTNVPLPQLEAWDGVLFDLDHA